MHCSGQVVRRYENQPFVQIAAHKEIHALTKFILQLYETLPLILNSNNYTIPSDPIYEDTTSLVWGMIPCVDSNPSRLHGDAWGSNYYWLMVVFDLSLNVKEL